MKNLFTLVVVLCSVALLVSTPTTECRAQNEVVIDYGIPADAAIVAAHPQPVYQVSEFGVPSILPVAYVEPLAAPGSYDIYGVSYGIRNPLPDYRIEAATNINATELRLYRFSYGVANPLPASTYQVMRE